MPPLPWLPEIPPNADLSRPDVQHRIAASAPALWQLKARDLVSAANFLIAPLERAMLSPPHMVGTKVSIVKMLYGMACENLLKAILTAQRGSLLNQTDALDSQYGHHELVRYAAAAGFPLSPEEQDLFDSLAVAIREGKYPIGRKPKTNLHGDGWYIGGDCQRIWALLTRLEDALRAAAGSKALEACDVSDL